MANSPVSVLIMQFLGNDKNLILNSKPAALFNNKICFSFIHMSFDYFLYFFLLTFVLASCFSCLPVFVYAMLSTPITYLDILQDALHTLSHIIILPILRATYYHFQFTEYQRPKKQNKTKHTERSKQDKSYLQRKKDKNYFFHKTHSSKKRVKGNM